MVNPWLVVMGWLVTYRHMTFSLWLIGWMVEFLTDSLSQSVVLVHLPPGLRAGIAEESECWVSVGGVMMCEVTGGGAWVGDVHLWGFFFCAKWCGPLDQTNPTVEIFVTLGIPRRLRAINRGCEQWLLTLPNIPWAAISEQLWSTCAGVFVCPRLVLWSSYTSLKWCVSVGYSYQTSTLVWHL